MNMGINMRQSPNTLGYVPSASSMQQQLNQLQQQPSQTNNDFQQSQWNGSGQYSSYLNQSNNSIQNTTYQSASGAVNQSSFQGQTSTAGSSSGQNFKVVIRVRPPLQRERIQGCHFRSIVRVGQNNKSCAIMEYLGAEVTEKEKQKDMDMNPHLCVWQNYTFDYVYDERSSQEFVYENTAKQSVISVLQGYNASVIAYGQTGTGKTHTMEGFKYNIGDPQRGIIPRSMEEIFKFIQMQSSKNTTFMVRVSYLQIYNEIISDLLKVERTSLQIREDKKRGVFVEGLSEWAVRSPNEVYALMQKGAQCRATATTKMNDLSSRSHAVFIIIVEQMTLIKQQQDESYNDDGPKQIKVGKLNLVDLAGSERVRVTQATGQRLEESKKINQSLSALGNVIAALTDLKSRPHIPYRDSKLTRILEDSLGGNCKTTMMAMVSPSSDAFGESQSTLKFATRAKKIKNEAKINEDIDQRTLLRKYEIELRRLKQELDVRNNGGNFPSNDQIQRLESEKRRAEEDKNAAITALEMRSRQFMQEQEQKKILEQKIQAMNSQILIGGKKIEDLPQFRNALEEKQRIMRMEFDEKMQEIEKERVQIEEDKQQVDRYKQLLLKQRDIMIALTSRLNERDETIIQLQEELEAYDRINRETEAYIELKNMRIEELQQFIKNDCNREVPNSKIGMNGWEEQMNRQFASFQERKYQPHQDWAIENTSLPLQLLTADEKIQELQQIIEARSLENNELKVKAGQDQGSSQQQSQKNASADSQKQLQEILYFVNSAFSDLRQVQKNPQMVQQVIVQKIKYINEQAQNQSRMDEYQSESGGSLNVSLRHQAPGQSQQNYPGGPGGPPGMSHSSQSSQNLGVHQKGNGSGGAQLIQPLALEASNNMRPQSSQSGLQHEFLKDRRDTTGSVQSNQQPQYSNPYSQQQQLAAQQQKSLPNQQQQQQPYTNPQQKQPKSSQQATHDSVSEMLRKRQMQKMRGNS